MAAVHRHAGIAFELHETDDGTGFQFELKSRNALEGGLLQHSFLVDGDMLIANEFVSV